MAEKEPVKIIFNPKTGRFRTTFRRTDRFSGRIIWQTKQCSSCPHLTPAKEVLLNEVALSTQVALSYFSEPECLQKKSAKKEPLKEKTEKESKVFGICDWGYWKVIYRVDKPRKCQKIQS